MVILQLCTKNLDDIFYSSGDIKIEIGHFFAILLLKHPENQHFAKMIKTSGDVIIFQMIQKAES